MNVVPFKTDDDIKLTNKEIYDLIKTAPGMKKLLNLANLSYKLKYIVRKIVKELEKKFDEIDQNRVKKILKYCNKDENAQPMIVDGNYDFPDQKSKDDWSKEYDAFISKENIFPFKKLVINFEDAVFFSVIEMISLESIAIFPDPEENNNVPTSY